MHTFDPTRIPRCCREVAPELREGVIVCTCGTRREVVEGIIVLDPSLEAVAPGASQYDIGTKHRYQSNSYAHRYLERYERPRSPYAAYSALIAARERAAVWKLLARVASEVEWLLDLPAGTGKLAAVHARFGYSVVAADVSADMLRIGLRAGAWDGCPGLRAMVQVDGTKTGFDARAFDCTVCLRLIHRLPRAVANAVARELRRVTSRYVIVAGGVRGRSLGGLLRMVRKKGAAREGTMTVDDWNSYVRQIGEPITSVRVFPGLSSETITLVRVNQG
jgi:SAM-dependent methyltransferase